MFRDESEGLSIRRQRIKNTQKPISIDAVSPKAVSKVFSDPGTFSTCPVAIPALTVNPCFSVEDQAKCFFFQNYVLGGDSFATGSFEFLPNVYLTGDIGIAMSDSLAALGLAGLAHFYKASSLELIAKFKYHSAMRTLSEQLRNLESAQSDQTFIAIMLLAYYEVNTCDSRQSMETWTKHINGAVTLMQLRGTFLFSCSRAFILQGSSRAETYLKSSFSYALRCVLKFLSSWDIQENYMLT